MRINTNELIVYKQFKHQAIFDDVTWIMNNYDNKAYNEDDIRRTLYKSINLLVELAASHGFEGNLWHSYVTFLLVDNENAFSTACEINGGVSGSINYLALNDFNIFIKLYSFNLSLIEEALGVNCFSLITDFTNINNTNSVFDKNIRNSMRELSVALGATTENNAFYDIITGFYKQFGVGKFGLHKAFRVQRHQDTVEIVPITTTEDVYLRDLVGYDFQKKDLIKNTEDFVKGYKANNVLLYGDSGTGKSSSIKAILNEYEHSGLRMIEVYKHQFGDLSLIIEQLKHRNYKFIIYMDDLSFEEYETEYKYLKAIIEGGLEARPDNVLLYATSNRRHLIREKWSDKEDRDDDLHTNDTVQEKLSLAARFGLSILYISPNRREFEHIVKVLADSHNITLPEEELYLEANRWELRHGGLSGRTAQHFITHLSNLKK
jgi:uncharacterized protein